MMEYVLYAAIATVILYIISRNVFLLRHHEKGVVYRSGKPARSAKPGVSFTLPFIEEFKRLDSREQILEMGERDIVSSDGKVFRGNVVVSYKLDDPLKVKLFDKNALDYDISRTASLALDETSVKINATSFKDELEPLLRDELNHRIKSSGVRAISVKIHNLSAAPTKPQKKTTKSSQIIDLVLSRGEISLSDAANELRTSEKTLEKQIE
ncbi:MAG: SPFH domain-containing protein, partial [Candidatus Altiarchaeota archaeon]